MRKLAVFVEGQTEAIFVEKLLEEVAGKNRLEIQRVRLHGKVRTVNLHATLNGIEQDYFVLVYDCEGHQNVKSDIRDNYNGLLGRGFEAIIGMRDVYPEFTHGDIPRLRRSLAYALKTKPVEVKMILCIMEIEAWFLAEHTHFTRIHSNLTLHRIATTFGFDPSQDDLELRPQPANDLDRIYHLVGFAYTKRRTNTERTVNALDYERIYVELRQESIDLNQLLDCIDRFLSLTVN